MDSTILHEAAEQVEAQHRLDPVADALHATGQSIPAEARRVLTGKALGSPLHPAVVHLPIGASVSALVVDLLGSQDIEPAAGLLTGLTLATALPAAATGVADYGTTRGVPVRRLGAAHALANVTGTALAAASWLARSAGATGVARALLAGSVAAYGVGGWLGGHIVHDEGGEE